MDNLKADANYYLTQFRGKLDIEINEIESLLKRAYENISFETMGRSENMEIYTPTEIEKVKRAACFEAEALYHIDGPHLDLFGSFRIGDYWVELGKGKNVTNGVGVLSRRAKAILETTSLKDRWL